MSLAEEQRQLLAALRRGEAPAGLDSDGFALASLLVAKLRVERLCRGCPEAEAALTQDPAAFRQNFDAWHAATPMHSFFPSEEASAWRRQSDAGNQ
ncbi:MAG: hypothetical protein RL095_2726 [Verrucomicrobiota bacterium]